MGEDQKYKHQMKAVGQYHSLVRLIMQYLAKNSDFKITSTPGEWGMLSFSVLVCSFFFFNV